MHVALVYFLKHLVRGFEMQVSTSRKVFFLCVFFFFFFFFGSAFSSVLPGARNDFSLFLLLLLSVGDPGRSDATAVV